MITEANVVALLADVIAKDENGSFDKVGAFTELKGGAYVNFAGIMVWAADGAAFQITVTRTQQHDLKVKDVEAEIEAAKPSPELHMRIATRTLKQLTKTLMVIDDGAIFKIDSDGITCKLVDGKNACMISIVIPALECTTFAIDDLKSAFAVGIDLDKMYQILDCGSDEAVVSLKLSPDTISLNNGLHGVTWRAMEIEKLRTPSDIEVRKFGADYFNRLHNERFWEVYRMVTLKKTHYMRFLAGVSIQIHDKFCECGKIETIQEKG